VVTGSEGRGVKQAPFRGPGGRGDAGGARRGGLHQQPGGGEAPRLRRVPGEDRGLARPRHRALPPGPLGAARGRARACRARRDPAAGQRPHRAGARGPPGHGGPHRAALGGPPALAGGLGRAGRGRHAGGDAGSGRRGGVGGRRIRVRLYFEAPEREASCPRSGRSPSRRTSRCSCARWSRSSRRARPPASWDAAPGDAGPRGLRAGARRRPRGPLGEAANLPGARGPSSSPSTRS